MVSFILIIGAAARADVSFSRAGISPILPRNIAPPSDGLPEGLSSWLYAATWVVPPLPPIPLTSGFFSINVQIDGLECSNIRVKRLRSAAVPRGHAPTLTLGLDDASLNCSTSEVKVNIERKGHKPFLTPHARVAVDVHGASLAAVMRLPVNAADGLPIGTNLSVANLSIAHLKPEIRLPGAWSFLDGPIDLAVEVVSSSAHRNAAPAVKCACGRRLLCMHAHAEGRSRLACVSHVQLGMQTMAIARLLACYTQHRERERERDRQPTTHTHTHTRTHTHTHTSLTHLSLRARRR